MENQTAEQAVQPQRDRKKLAKVFISLIIVAILGIVGYYAYENYYYVTTDDAMITGDLYRVAPKIPGKITKVDVQEGQQVSQGQILMEMDQEGVANVEDTFIRSPISGTVIQKTGLPGEVVGAGNLVAMVVSKKNLYVEANVEETNAESIKVGQPVDITVDMYSGKTYHGKVKEIKEATQSVFSMLPQTNAGGNFTKVTQRVPIDIYFDQPFDFRPGLNAVVKIHIR